MVIKKGQTWPKGQNLALGPFFIAIHFYHYTGLSLAPQFLAKQLTLSQPGGQIMPTTVMQAPGFSDLATLIIDFMSQVKIFKSS